MADVGQDQVPHGTGFIGEFGETTIVLAREFRLGKSQVELAQDLGGCRKVRAPRAKLVTELTQDALHFGEFAVLELHQFVVQRHRLHRLEVKRRARRARAVNDAVHAVLFFGADGQDEPLVADGDHRILQHSCLAETAEKFLEGRLDFDLQAFDRASNTSESRAGRGVDGSLRQDLALQFSNEIPEVSGAARERAEACEGTLQEHAAKIAGRPSDLHQREDFERRARFSLDRQSVQDWARVLERAEAWTRTLAQALASLSREFVLPPDTLEIGARLKRAKQGLADRTREKSAHEFKDAGKLQRVTGKAVVREAWISHADVLFDREKDPNTES